MEVSREGGLIRKRWSTPVIENSKEVSVTTPKVLNGLLCLSKMNSSNLNDITKKSHGPVLLATRKFRDNC